MLKNRTCANTPALSRRSLMVGLAAAPAILCGPSVAAVAMTATPAAQLPEWWQQLASNLRAGEVPHRTKDYRVVKAVDLDAIYSAAQVGSAKLRTAPDTSGILDVIHELESWECWENASIVAAKAYAAYRMREALGLDLPHPKYARAHLDLQVWNFEDYRKSIWYERDKAAGKTMTAPRPGLSIG